MTDIKDIDFYISEMKKSLKDKLWFTSFLDSVITTDHIILDYGCGDGTVTAAIAERYPNNIVVGYDNSETMINLATKLYGDKSVSFITDMKTFKKINNNDKKVIVILSSVFNELCNYGGIYNFIDLLYKIEVDYIYLRDMAILNNLSANDDIYFKSYLKNCIDKIKKYSYAKEEEIGFNLYKDYNRYKPRILNLRGLLDFLLKYRYVANWKRELLENYVNDLEKVLNIFSNTHIPVYIRHYSIPFIKNKIKEDMDIELDYPTHVNIIFKRKLTKLL